MNDAGEQHVLGVIPTFIVSIPQCRRLLPNFQLKHLSVVTGFVEYANPELHEAEKALEPMFFLHQDPLRCRSHENLRGAAMECVVA